VERGLLAPSAELVRSLGRDLADASRGVIVCGPQDDPQLPDAVTRLAQRLGYPVLADALSGVRNGAHDLSLVIDRYDAFLRDEGTLERLEPAIVLRFGAIPTSKPLLQFLQRYPGARQIVVDPGGWREPTGLASDVLHVEPRLLCDALGSGAQAANEWTQTWLDTNRLAANAIGDHLGHEQDLFEGKVFAE